MSAEVGGSARAAFELTQAYTHALDLGILPLMSRLRLVMELLEMPTGHLFDEGIARVLIEIEHGADPR